MSAHRVAATLYRTLLSLHPPGFRQRFGAEMLEAFDAGAPEFGLATLLCDAAGSLARQRMLRSAEDDATGAQDALLSGSYPAVLPLVPTFDKWLAAFVLSALASILIFPTAMWASEAPRAQAPAAARPEFEVASIREDKTTSGSSTSNVPLNAGTQFTDTGGVLSGTNLPVLQLLVFAYKLDMYQIGVFRSQLPDWARTTRYTVQAKAPGHPDKDQMRLMMQVLLEQRFGLKVHTESRDTPAYALELVKPGRRGPQLQLHPADDPDCKQTPLLPPMGGGAYPPSCGMPASIAAKTPGNTAAGGRNVAPGMLAMAIGGIGNLTDRPVVDRTGLTGTYDFTLEFTPEPPAGDASAAAAPAGTATFQEALREQLGLRLVATRLPIEVIVLDHLEKPTAN